MIQQDEAIRGWNNAGAKVNADLLTYLFRMIDNPTDADDHNFVMRIIKTRLGGNQQAIWHLCLSVAGLIEQYSMEVLNAAQKEKEQRAGQARVG